VKLSFSFFNFFLEEKFFWSLRLQGIRKLYEGPSYDCRKSRAEMR
jgi:hypothetical protein